VPSLLPSRLLGGRRKGSRKYVNIGILFHVKKRANIPAIILARVPDYMLGVVELTAYPLINSVSRRSAE